MPSALEISRQATLKPVTEIAAATAASSAPISATSIGTAQACDSAAAICGSPGAAGSRARRAVSTAR